MVYRALATDYDGTIAHDGHVDAPMVAALQRLSNADVHLLLVTGRELPQLLELFPQALELFDAIVAENGALLYWPSTQETQVLSEQPAKEFVAALRKKDVKPLSVGQGIVATFRPNETIVLEVIRELGLEMQVIFNKDAVMVLPSGVNKATGLTAALKTLGIKAHLCVGVGDAENDHAFLSMCGCSAAVGNALPAVKERATVVLTATHGAGVMQLIERMLDGTLPIAEPAKQAVAAEAAKLALEAGAAS